MKPIIPKTKADEAYEYINQYIGLTQPKNLRAQSWLRDFDSLVKSDPVKAWQLKAWAYILLGQPQKAVSAIQNAYRLDESETNAINYATLLFSIGRYDESDEICLRSLKNNSHDIPTYRRIMSNALFTLDMTNTNHALNLLKSDQNKISEIVAETQKKIDYHRNILSEINISINVFKKMNQSICQFLCQYYVGNHTLVPIKEYTELGAHLRMKVFLKNVSIEDCLNFNESFLDTIISDDTWSFNDYYCILVSFLPEKD